VGKASYECQNREKNLEQQRGSKTARASKRMPRSAVRDPLPASRESQSLSREPWSQSRECLWPQEVQLNRELRAASLDPKIMTRTEQMGPPVSHNEEMGPPRHSVMRREALSKDDRPKQSGRKESIAGSLGHQEALRTNEGNVSGTAAVDSGGNSTEQFTAFKTEMGKTENIVDSSLDLTEFDLDYLQASDIGADYLSLEECSKRFAAPMSDIDLVKEFPDTGSSGVSQGLIISPGGMKQEITKSVTMDKALSVGATGQAADRETDESKALLAIQDSGPSDCKNEYG
jgi:hypothetical protein